MRVDSTNYEFRHPEAQLLADLTIVRRDLERVLELLAPLRLGEGWANFPWHTEEMHWNCAVIRYMRAFSDGVLDWNWKAALTSLDEEKRNTHETVRAQRNKYIAHSVNEFEEAMPVVQVCVGEDGSMEIRAVHCNLGRIIGASSVLVERFHELATALGETVVSMIESERNRLLTLACSIGPDELVKGETWMFKGNSARPTRPRQKLKGPLKSY